MICSTILYFGRCPVASGYGLSVFHSLPFSISLSSSYLPQWNGGTTTVRIYPPWSPEHFCILYQTFTAHSSVHKTLGNGPNIYLYQIIDKFSKLKMLVPYVIWWYSRGDNSFIFRTSIQFFIIFLRWNKKSMVWKSYWILIKSIETLYLSLVSFVPPEGTFS